MRETVIQRTLSDKIIAIVRGMEESKILPLAEALHKGGVTMIEVTFNQSKPDSFVETARAIASIKKRFGQEVLAGAGTVITREQLKMAAESGAEYIISPHTDVEIIKETRALGLVSMPGALTPSECVAANTAGADFVKLFPLGVLGANYLKQVRAPLSHIKFLGVGGISEKNIGEFVKAGACGFGIGGGLVNKDWIDAGEFEKITALAKIYIEAVKA